MVLDQRLNLSGTARYEGADLADSCRSILPHLPIYIFTNHPEDFIEGDNMGEILGPGTVEYVLSKNDTADAEKQDKISMRVRRHISQFNNISRSIDNRLHELLEKKVKGTLDPGEENELDKINHFRSRPIVSAEALGTASLKKILDANEILLTKLEKRIKSI